ncbi:rod shape-determining protein MreC [Pedobacter sp. PWIIR3]
MRNLWIFLNRYNAFFFFIIFFTIGIVLTIKNNAYQRSVTVNSTNKIVGDVYTNMNVARRYLNLGTVNDSLARENALLKTQVLALKNIDTAKDITLRDTSGVPQYTYLSARVVKNSIALRNNIITVNRGSADSIASGMPVISPGNGIVGYIRDVSEHFATIRSLLHKDTYISVNIKKNKAVGSLIWGDGNFDYRKAYIKDIPNHFKLNLGDTVITSNFSSFPAGIPVGKVSNTGISKGDNFKLIEVILFNDFSALQYVYVIKDKFAKEQQALEAKVPDEQ